MLDFQNINSLLFVKSKFVEEEDIWSKLIKEHLFPNNWDCSHDKA